ncbi:ORFL242W [Human betaherpesvirus 5]|nr:ORFL242W [Human betaherpesvirus 5]QHX40613.1 ORFL242W [Human betaherpesvirus 5]
MSRSAPSTPVCTLWRNEALHTNRYCSRSSSSSAR